MTVNLSIARRYDFIVKQNQTFNPVISFTDQDGNPVNLLGASAKISVRLPTYCLPCLEGEQSTNLVYKQDLIGTIGGASHNEIHFNSIIEVVHALFKYDLLITFSDGTQVFYLYGNFKVERTFTTNEN